MTRTFSRSDHAPRDARRFVADVFDSWGLDPADSDVLLVVSELATNAVRHAESDFTVSLTRDGAAVTIVVGDCDPTRPSEREPDLSGGRGLHIITALVEAWGHEPVEGGKLVWVKVPAAV